MTVSICSIGEQGSDAVAICFAFQRGDQYARERLIISSSQFAALSPTCGACTRERYEEIAHAAKVFDALRKGLASLSYGSCSSGALLRKLVRKGTDREIAAEAVSLLREQGYLDDVGNAKREAERCVEKRWGQRRILSSLREKGYSDGAIRAAAEHLREMDVDFVQLCAEQMISKRSLPPQSSAEREKLFAAMLRYGYSGSEIRLAYELYLENADG